MVILLIILWLSDTSVVLYVLLMLTDWNRDWMPGPYPKTPEERAAAAKKYNLRVEDYEPYPDDGTGFGDYPKLPLVSATARNPYEVYDIPEFKRNYNEPVRRQSC